MTTKTDAPEKMIALETLFFEGGKIQRGDVYDASDPLTKKYAQVFAPANSSPQQIRQLEADSFAKSTEGAWQPEPPPPPIRMKAVRRFTAELITSTHREIAKGEIFDSDSDVFLSHPQMFEPIDRKRGK